MSRPMTSRRTRATSRLTRGTNASRAAPRTPRTPRTPTVPPLPTPPVTSRPTNIPADAATPTPPTPPAMYPYYGTPYGLPHDAPPLYSAFAGNGGPVMSSAQPPLYPMSSAQPPLYPMLSSAPVPPPQVGSITQMELHMLANGIDDLKRTVSAVGGDMTSVRIAMESMKGTIMPRTEITDELNQRVHQDVFKQFQNQVAGEIQTLRSGPTRMVSYVALGISALIGLIDLISYFHH